MCVRDRSLDSQVMLYLKLRSEGCPKRTARLFCGKKACKVRQTQPQSRILKLLPDRNLSQGGWQPATLMKYDLGEEYRSADDFAEELSKAEKAIMEKYEELEERRSAALLQRMLAMKSLAGSRSSASPIEKLKQISNELRTSQTKKFFEVGDVRFYELVDHLPGRQESQNSRELPFIRFDNVVPEGFRPKLRYRKSVGGGAKRRESQVSPKLAQIEDEAELMMELQKSPEKKSLKGTEADPGVLSLLRRQTQKQDLAEEFNQSQYLFSPSKSHTRVPSHTDARSDLQLQSFVARFYEQQSGAQRELKAKTQQNSTSRSHKKKNIKLKTFM